MTECAYKLKYAKHLAIFAKMQLINNIEKFEFTIPEPRQRHIQPFGINGTPKVGIVKTKNCCQTE